MKKKYIVVKQTGKSNATFRVTNPKKIEFWKMIAEKVSGSVVKNLNLRTQDNHKTYDCPDCQIKKSGETNRKK